MSPNGYVMTDVSGEPVSRTYQYRKVMKPMLERKRRARINRCLDELKDLMAGAFQAVGFKMFINTTSVEHVLFITCMQNTDVFFAKYLCVFLSISGR